MRANRSPAGRSCRKRDGRHRGSFRLFRSTHSPDFQRRNRRLQLWDLLKMAMLRNRCLVVIAVLLLFSLLRQFVIQRLALHLTLSLLLSPS